MKILHQEYAYLFLLVLMEPAMSASCDLGTLFGTEEVREEEEEEEVLAEGVAVEDSGFIESDSSLSFSTASYIHTKDNR